MRTALLMLVLFSFGSLPAYANTIVAKVDGMVCAFCAKGLEDKLKQDPKVENVIISLEDTSVTVSAKPGQTIARETVEKAIYYMDFALRDLKEMP